MYLDEYTVRCMDESCGMHQSCPLYTTRDNTKARIKAFTLRLIDEPRGGYCKTHQTYHQEDVDES